jgi:hypothetical protein
MIAIGRAAIASISPVFYAYDFQMENYGMMKLLTIFFVK